MTNQPSDSSDQESHPETSASNAVRDRLPDLVAQYVPEEITRRQAIVSVAGLAVVLSAFSPSSSEKQAFDRAQAEFRNLATTIDKSDLGDPKRATRLKSSVSETLENVESTLGPVADRGIDRTNTTSIDKPNTSAETSPQSPSIQERLTHAQAYYRSLERVLARAVSVHDSLRAIEPIILYNTDPSPSDLLADVPIGTLNLAIESRFSTSQQSTSDSTSHFAELYPDRQAVTTQLRDLARVYNRLIATQRATLDSGLTVVDATIHHEHGEFKKARTAFTTAREQADVQVPAQFAQYDVNDSGLTLGQYDRLLSVRGKGIEVLRKASAPEIEESARRTAFNEGLNRLLQARRILTENSLPPAF